MRTVTGVSLRRDRRYMSKELADVKAYSQNPDGMGVGNGMVVYVPHIVPDEILWRVLEEDTVDLGITDSKEDAARLQC